MKPGVVCAHPFNRLHSPLEGSHASEPNACPRAGTGQGSCCPVAPKPPRLPGLGFVPGMEPTPGSRLQIR